MAARSDDARGHVKEAFAAQELRQGLVVVDAAAMEVGCTVGKSPQPFGAGGGGEPELDLREGVVELRGGGREDGLRPGRVGGDAQYSGSAGAHGVDGLVGRLELAQDAARSLGHGGAERGEAHAVRQALEQLSPEAVLEAGDVAGQRRLGDGEPFGGGGDPPRVGDGEESDEIGSLVEHGDVPRCWGGRPHVLLGYMWGLGPGIQTAFGG